MSSLGLAPGALQGSSSGTTWHPCRLHQPRPDDLVRSTGRPVCPVHQGDRCSDQRTRVTSDRAFGRERRLCRGVHEWQAVEVWSPGGTVVHQEIWKGRLWAARPLTVVEDATERTLLWMPFGTRRKVPVTPPSRADPPEVHARPGHGFFHGSLGAVNLRSPRSLPGVGALGTTRTCDRRIRSPMLYPAELRGPVTTPRGPLRRDSGCRRCGRDPRPEASRRRARSQGAIPAAPSIGAEVARSPLPYPPGAHPIGEIVRSTRYE